VRQGWSLPALPGAHSCIAPGHEDRGLWRNDYFCNSTFQ